MQTENTSLTSSESSIHFLNEVSGKTEEADAILDYCSNHLNKIGQNILQSTSQIRFFIIMPGASLELENLCLCGFSSFGFQDNPVGGAILNFGVSNLIPNSLWGGGLIF